jgi:hypothetical protein
MSNRFSGSPDQINFSPHALCQMKHRGFNEKDVRTIVDFGHRTMLEEDRCLYTILPSPFAVLDVSGDRERLTDCSALLSADGEVVTVYHNDQRCPLYRTLVLVK